MRPRPLALSRAYVRLVAASPIAWTGLAVAAVSTYLVALDASRTLLRHGLRFQLLEVAFFVLANEPYVTWSILFCFLLVAWPMLQARDSERSLLRRLDSRRDIWLGRSLAVLKIAAAFLALLALAGFSATAPNHALATQWSHAYVQAAGQRAGAAAGTIDDAAFEHFAYSWSPAGLAVAELGLLVLVLWAVGLFGMVVTEAAPGSATSFTVVFAVSVLAYAALSYLGFRRPALLLPAGHLMITGHVAEDGQWCLPYWASAAYWAVVLVFFHYVGALQIRRAALG